MKNLFIYTPLDTLSGGRKTNITPHILEHCLGETINKSIKTYFDRNHKCSFYFYERYTQISFDDSIGVETILEQIQNAPSYELYEKERKLVQEEYHTAEEKEKQYFIRKHYREEALIYDFNKISYKQFIKYFETYIKNISWILMEKEKIIKHHITHSINPLNQKKISYYIKNKNDIILRYPIGSLENYAKLIWHHIVLNERSRYYYRYLSRTHYDYPQTTFFQTHDSRILHVPDKINEIINGIDGKFLKYCNKYMMENFNKEYDSNWKALFLFLLRKKIIEKDLHTIRIQLLEKNLKKYKIS